MKLLNRAVLLVRYREPFLRWAASLDEDAPIHAEGLETHVSVYLVPEDPSGEHETPPLRQFFAAIFEHELESWWQDPEDWPPRRDFDMFNEWFTVTGDSLVLDFGTEPIEGEQH